MVADVSEVVGAIAGAGVAIAAVGLARLLVHSVVKGQKAVGSAMTGYSGGQKIGSDTEGRKIHWYSSDIIKR